MSERCGYTDPVTGFSGLRPFLDKASEKTAMGRPFSILVFDIDFFQYINEHFGYTGGDMLLRRVADLLENFAGENGFPSRVGDDSFAFFCESASGDAFIKLFEAPLRFGADGLSHNVVVSAGMASYPRDSENAEELYNMALRAMRASKRQGESHCDIYSPELHGLYKHSDTPIEDMRRGLENDEYVLYYQPIMDLHSNKVTGAEALIRWVHPERGLVSPADFLPLAEESGFITELGQWVLNSVCRQISEWRELSLKSLEMTINVSKRQLSEPGFAHTLAEILRKYDIEPGSIVLDFPESVTSGDEHLPVLKALDAMGFILSADDLGPGVVSLKNDTPLRRVKIDYSFIRDAAAGIEAGNVVATFVSTIKGLGLRSLAEGVEKWEQFSFLKEIGCDEMQGYYLSPPIPPSRFQRYLLN